MARSAEVRSPRTGMEGLRAANGISLLSRGRESDGFRRLARPTESQSFGCCAHPVTFCCPSAAEIGAPSARPALSQSQRSGPDLCRAG